MATLDIQGYSVTFDDNAKEGIDHLAYAPYDEVKALFDQAAETGSASFSFGGAGYKIFSSGGGSYNITKTY